MAIKSSLPGLKEKRYQQKKISLVIYTRQAKPPSLKSVDLLI